MVFNVSWLLLLFFLIVAAWMAVLTILVVRIRAHYNSLTQGISKKNLGEALTKILLRLQEVSGRTDKLEKELLRLSGDSTLHLSRIGLVRFNPFSDTGGSQSFTLALLDERNNGLVMTSLYARTGNRWYVKEVHMGAGVNIDLSKEELAAIKRAQLTKEL